MTDALLLVGRRTERSGEVLSTHARRLRERAAADAVHVVQYTQNPTRTVTTALDDVEAETAVVIPIVVDREHFPTDAVAAATPTGVRVSEPIGHSPAVTDLLLDRAHAAADAPTETSLVLVGLGRGGAASTERAVESHAARVRASACFDQVVTGYLVADPSVECVGYEVVNDDVVVVPLFVADDESVTERVPDRLRLPNRTVAYTSPLGTHDLLTRAIEAELARQCVLAAGRSPTAIGPSPSGTSLVADGDGAQRFSGDGTE
ncbi:MAG: CbiX/SirB N-terminal domain-containing protein [Haloarculaceae archaeon]